MSEEVEVGAASSLAPPRERHEDGEPVAGMAVAIALLALGVSTLTLVLVAYRAKSKGAVEVKG